MQKICQFENNMKRTVLNILLLITLSTATSISARAEKFFELPIIPDTMAFEQKTSYLVTHYWDFCDLKKAFSSRQRMATAFKEYLDLMPLVNTETALNSINSFINGLKKQPKDLLFITSTAEEYMYSDTAMMTADHLYLPFAQATAEHKKIDKASKMRYERQARLLTNSMVGAKAPDFTYIDRNGEKRNFAADTATIVALYIYDTDCTDCSLAKIRLHADVNTTKLIDAKQFKIVALSPTTPDAEWRNIVKDYPENWQVGALEDLDDIIEIRTTPTFYLLDKNHTIYAKNITLEQLLEVNRQLAARTRDPYISRMKEQTQQQTEIIDNTSSSTEVEN